MCTPLLKTFSCHIFLHCLVFIDFNYWPFENLSFIVQSTLENIKINLVVSEFVSIQQRECFQPVHYHDINSTHRILLPMYHLF